MRRARLAGRRVTVAFGAMLDDHRVLYNAALQERRDAYRHPPKTRIRSGDQPAQVKDIRAGDPDEASPNDALR
nr:hypothetical protein [Frankia tisae]